MPMSGSAVKHKFTKDFGKTSKEGSGRWVEDLPHWCNGTSAGIGGKGNLVLKVRDEKGKLRHRFYKKHQFLNRFQIRTSWRLLTWIWLFGLFEPFFYLARTCAAGFRLIPFLAKVFSNSRLIRIIIDHNTRLHTRLREDEQYKCGNCYLFKVNHSSGKGKLVLVFVPIGIRLKATFRDYLAALAYLSGASLKVSLQDSEQKPKTLP